MVYKTRYFTAVTAAALAAMHGYIVQLPAFKENPILKPDRCLKQPWVTPIPLQLSAVDDILCPLNTLIRAGNTFNPAATALSIAFGAFGVCSCLIAVYTSFRPSSRRSGAERLPISAVGFGMNLGLAQLATPFLALGQVISLAVALPAYYAFVSFATEDTPIFNRHRDRQCKLPTGSRLTPDNANIPRTSSIYGTLVSVIVGFLLPTAYMMYDNFSYLSVTIWQFFPLLMMVVTVVLPPLLRRSFRSVPSTGGIILIAALGIVSSVLGQYALFASGASLKDIFLLGDRDMRIRDDFNTATHFLFIVDLAFAVLATASQVIFTLKPRSGVDIAKNALIILVGGVILGPGAPIMALWAKGEIDSFNATPDNEPIKHVHRHKDE